MSDSTKNVLTKKGKRQTSRKTTKARGERTRTRAERTRTRAARSQKPPQARHDSFAWVEKFLRSLRVKPNISAAARSAGVTRQYVYDVRSLKNKDGAAKEGDDLKRAQEFAAAWDDAIQESLDELETEAWRRAKVGVTRLKFTRGGEPIYLPDTGDKKIQYGEQEYSDALMQFLLRVHRYGDKHQHELTGKDGAPIEVQDMEAVRAKRWLQVAPALATVLTQSADDSQQTTDV